jgi:ferrochelatase
MYDALLVVSFGGPEKPDDVMPFLENVTRGRNIPRERLLGVAEHYYHFGGKSPINDQNRALITALKDELKANGVDLPIYWGNRNWHPTLPEALSRMKADGIKSALAFVTSAYSSYSSCRQYRENIKAAQSEIGPGAPNIDKLRVFYNHPGFIEACAERVREGLSALEGDGRWLIFTAHSIPTAMANTSDYERQFQETAGLVSEAVGFSGFQCAYQSRSGAPNQPWLGPDILECLRTRRQMGFKNVLVAPIGFISDHMEVLYDLDIEAQELAKELGIKMVRAGTAGTHPAFVRTIRQLIQERLNPDAPKLAIGKYGPNHDFCPDYCCPVLTRAGTIHALASREP